MSALILAIPSKGRLKDQTEAYLARCGFKLRQTGGDRSYQASLKGMPGVEILLLSASEIAAGLVEGKFHLGVTGEDLLRERTPTLKTSVSLLKPLGFGHARVIVAVPKAWLDVDTMADLAAAASQFHDRTGRRMRVATKFIRLSRDFFAERGVLHHEIVDSAGATEAAPASGAAELIVDITSSGATLEANNLKIIRDGTMLESQANLAGSLGADWSSDTRDTLKALLDTIEAQYRAARLVRLDLPPSTNPSILAALADLDGVELREGVAFVARDTARDVARTACAMGAAYAAIIQPDFLFEPENALFETFNARLS